MQVIYPIRGSYPKHIRSSHNLTAKQQITQVKMGKRPEKAFPHLYEDIQMSNRYMNDGHVNWYSLCGQKNCCLSKIKKRNINLAALVAQIVKNLPAMQETQVRSLGWEALLEKGMATHPSILAWRIPQTQEPGGLQFMGWQSQTQLSN